jgi:hypothetical protein
MGKWHRKAIFVAGSGYRVGVKTRGIDDLSEDEVKDLGQGVTEVLACLRNTIALLQSDWDNLIAAQQRKINLAAQSFLNTNGGDWGGLTDHQRRKLLAKLELTLNGLNNSHSLSIKVAGEGETKDLGTEWEGKVNWSVSRLLYGKHLWDDRYSKSTFNYGGLKVSAVMGDIHVARDQIDGGTDLVRLIIHEATHKFAGTRDHSYVQYGSQLEYDISTADCLENADSLAFFCVNVV